MPVEHYPPINPRRDEYDRDQQRRIAAAERNRVAEIPKAPEITRIVRNCAAQCGSMAVRVRVMVDDLEKLLGDFPQLKGFRRAIYVLEKAGDAISEAVAPLPPTPADPVPPEKAIVKREGE